MHETQKKRSIDGSSPKEHPLNKRVATFTITTSAFMVCFTLILACCTSSTMEKFMPKVLKQ
uniref:Uncharacterized protein n=1 Tax=Setaria italica TaxID=4555 RepID=K3YBJ2_SETIT